jgi:hypothetical protein
MQQRGITLQAECRVAGDKTKRAHAIANIICYF